MFADQNPGRLLLLRVGSAGVPPKPRHQLRQDGIGDDQSH